MLDIKKKKLRWVWCWMKQRCNNKNTKAYKDYWWRWITYDPRREKFENFYEDMNKWWQQWLSIDRIDNNWNYCKENCRWATPWQQMRNTRRNRNWFKDEFMVSYLTHIRDRIDSIDDLHTPTRNHLRDKGINDLFELALRINNYK